MKAIAIVQQPSLPQPTATPTQPKPTMANRAAWQETLKGHPLTLKPAPMPTPRPDQIIIKTRATGINPADAAVQRLGLIYTPAQHPLILGLDVAGEVHAVGSSVTSFKVGDRVCAHAVDIPTPESASSHSPRGAFQLFCAVSAGLAAKIPDDAAFADAAVFPSCLSVAAYALFLPHTLALTLPPVVVGGGGGAAAPNGRVLVVWGGSSVVGSCAIQLARRAGYSVVATASELNFAHCRSLGAEAVFDYRDASVVDGVVAACEGRECAGVFAAYYNDGSTVACSRIASRLAGSKVVATVVPPSMPVPADVAEGVRIASSESPSQSRISHY